MKKLFRKERSNVNYWQILRRLLVLVLVVLAAVAGKVTRDLKTAVDTMSQEVAVDPMREQDVELTQGHPINVLLVGLDGDARENDPKRSDTLILVNVNPENQSMKMLSIPRDTLVDIPGQSEPDKVNHAFAFGGIELTIETLQNYLQVPIDYYAVINMQSLIEVIDAIGGIEVTSPLSFEYRGTEFHEGETRQVDGVKAMNFARMRYDDPEGEIGRQNRQKIVIKAMIDKVLSMDGVAAYPRLLQVVSRNVQTNVNLGELLSIYQYYLPALNHISSIKFEQLEEVFMDEVFYFNIPLSSRVKVSNEYRLLSGLRPITQSALADPLGTGEAGQEGEEEQGMSATRTDLVIINQYPSGLTEEDYQEVMDEQSSIETIRQHRHQAPAEPAQLPTYESYSGYSTSPSYSEGAGSGGNSQSYQNPGEPAGSQAVNYEEAPVYEEPPFYYSYNTPATEEPIEPAAVE
ncbi:LCP family protein [Suicoccus acidiformans]|uniref:LCP family protein n=1 Tax=Suicoccus acidiformans TaxID=2036206 RepID=UPI0013C347FB|nr:LCP family protein [Suicoccus acidiformans]